MGTPAQAIGDLVEHLRSAGTAGFAAGLHLTYTSPRYLLQSYPPAWQEIYARNGYLMLDPTVHWGLENDGWIRWSELRGIDTAGILAEAAGHGLLHGITVAIIARGSRSIASFARGDRDYTDAEAARIQVHFGELHHLTLSVHALPPAVHEMLRRLSIILTRH